MTISFHIHDLVKHGNKIITSNTTEAKFIFSTVWDNISYLSASTFPAILLSFEEYLSLHNFKYFLQSIGEVLCYVPSDPLLELGAFKPGYSHESIALTCAMSMDRFLDLVLEVNLRVNIMKRINLLELLGSIKFPRRRTQGEERERTWK